jgi:hypothetical protein
MTHTDPTRGLPPKPDPETGQPRPPHAPSFIGNRQQPDQDLSRETRLSAKPQAPDGQGPVLAWYRSSRRGAWSAGIVGVILIVGILFVIKGFEIRVLEIWWVWLVAIAAGIGMYFSTKASWCATGADWFTFQKSWVKTYELTEIKTRFYSNTIYVYLTDTKNHKVEFPIHIVQKDRLMWDLLYNGIRHSIAKGARLTGTAGNYFSAGLPTPEKPAQSTPTDQPDHDGSDKGSEENQ